MAFGAGAGAGLIATVAWGTDLMSDLGVYLVTSVALGIGAAVTAATLGAGVGFATEA